jgi:23S rRNA (guanosine2251-2'-O)-methyltransferase
MMKQKTTLSNDFIYGFHTISAVLKYQPERGKKLFIARKDSLALKELAIKAQVPCELVDRSWLAKKFNVGTEAQGVVLLCSPFSYMELDELIKTKPQKILLLDSLQDSVNLGRSARAALCFGADAMIICKDRSAQINASAEKSAVGALARIPVIRVVNLAVAIKKIKEAGFFVYGADENGEIPIKRCDFANKSALVIGQEGEGLRCLIKKTCDVLIRIPMANTSICLNAADTALLILYELHARTIND